MFKFDLICKSRKELISEGYNFVENSDGTLSLFNGSGENYSVLIENKPCCEASGYNFDIERQRCLWQVPNNSSCGDPFKVLLNPNGNEGVFFNVEENETCQLDVSFEYLFKFGCDNLVNVIKNGGSSANDKESKKKLEEIEYKLKEKEEEYAKITSELTYYTERLGITTLPPFVIECVGLDGWEEKSKLYNDLESKGRVKDRNEEVFKKTEELNSQFYNTQSTEEAKKALEDAIRKASKKLPPSAFPITSQSSSKLCINTPEGLSTWESIIGSDNYQTWVQSEGSNTNTYDCNDFITFKNSDNTNNRLYDEDCGYSTSERVKVSKQRKELEAVISKITSEVRYVEKEIEECEKVKEEILSGSEGDLCQTISDVFESFSVEFTVEVKGENGRWESVYTNELINIGEGNLLDYLLQNHDNSGFLIDGFSECEYDYTVPLPPSDSNFVATSLIGLNNGTVGAACNQVEDVITDELYKSFELATGGYETENEVNNFIAFSKCWYRSTYWKDFAITIPSDVITNNITNNDINVSFKINGSCVDFSILVDKVKLIKNCTKVDNVETFISEAPKFEIQRVEDNKKSWHAKDEKESRGFDLKYRDTEYDVNHHKLVINTKEVDLNLDPARAVEHDLFCYVKNNPEMLGCSTGKTSTLTLQTNINFNQLLEDNAEDCFCSDISECDRLLAEYEATLTQKREELKSKEDELSIAIENSDTNEIIRLSEEIEILNKAIEDSENLIAYQREVCAACEDEYAAFIKVRASIEDDIAEVEQDLQDAINNGDGQVIIDEIQTLIDQYNDDLDDVNEELSGYFPCVVDEFCPRPTDCTVFTDMKIVARFNCEVIYTNESFYASEDLTDVPTEALYVSEIEQIASTIGATTEINGSFITLTYEVSCDEDRPGPLSIDLELSSECINTKEFQDNDNFQFQDGEDFEFN